jgi:hypothetical protein
MLDGRVIFADLGIIRTDGEIIIHASGVLR